MRVVSVAHVALINQDVKVEAKDDADDAAWFEVQINDLSLIHISSFVLNIIFRLSRISS